MGTFLIHVIESKLISDIFSPMVYRWDTKEQVKTEICVQL